MSSSSVPVDWLPLEIGFAAGFLGRLYSLRPGRREYPGHPSGYISQLALAVIAALIGGSIITSLLAKQFTAATFLTLAATQFRDVRQTEAKSLTAEESLILVPRGPGYIEGIAQTYEARNYLAMLVAVVDSAITALFGHFFGTLGGLIAGIAGGIVIIIISEIFMQGSVIEDFMEVSLGKTDFKKESLLYVENVMLMEVGLSDVRKIWREQGMGVILKPKTPQGEAILWNMSQRQAITHEAAMAVGVKKDMGYPDFTPLTRMDMPAGTGYAALGIIPYEHDEERLLKAVRKTPILEASKMQRLVGPVLKKEASHG